MYSEACVDLAPFLMHLVQRERLTDEEVAQIRRLLDAYEPPRRKASKNRKRRTP